VDFIRALFSRRGVFIAIYLLIGVFVNTAAPHIPAAALTAGALHSWVQYFISIFFWPLTFWNPNFTVGQWTP
jgi:hypothetical protein